LADTRYCKKYIFSTIFFQKVDKEGTAVTSAEMKIGVKKYLEQRNRYYIKNNMFYYRKRIF